MKLKTKLLKKKQKKNKPYELTKDIPDIGEVTFIIDSISLGDLLNYSDTYPSVHKLITGMDLDADSIEDMEMSERIKTISEVIEMYNVIVALGVTIKDGKEEVSFVVEGDEEEDLVPSEVLGQEILLELGQLVVQNFRLNV